VEKTSKMQNSAKPPSELKLDGDNAAEWSFFVQKLNIYLQATKVEKETEGYKGAVLLNCVGDKALKFTMPSSLKVRKKRRVSQAFKRNSQPILLLRSM
jgi:hypothetical protein